MNNNNSDSAYNVQGIDTHEMKYGIPLASNSPNDPGFCDLCTPNGIDEQLLTELTGPLDEYGNCNNLGPSYNADGSNRIDKLQYLAREGFSDSIPYFYWFLIVLLIILLIYINY